MDDSRIQCGSWDAIALPCLPDSLAAQLGIVAVVQQLGEQPAERMALPAFGDQFGQQTEHLAEQPQRAVQFVAVGLVNWTRVVNYNLAVAHALSYNMLFICIIYVSGKHFKMICIIRN